METIIMRRVQVTQANGVPCGALVVKGKSRYKGDTTTIYRLDEHGNTLQAFYVPVSEYTDGAGKTAYAAVFPTLSPGNYKVWEPGYTTIGAKTITIFPGCIAEVTYS